MAGMFNPSLTLSFPDEKQQINISQTCSKYIMWITIVTSPDCYYNSSLVRSWALHRIYWRTSAGLWIFNQRVRLVLIAMFSDAHVCSSRSRLRNNVLFKFQQSRFCWMTLILYTYLLIFTRLRPRLLVHIAPLSDAILVRMSTRWKSVVYSQICIAHCVVLLIIHLAIRIPYLSRNTYIVDQLAAGYNINPAHYISIISLTQSFTIYCIPCQGQHV